MLVANVLDIVDKKKNVYVHDIANGYIITHCDEENTISTNVLNYPVERITTTDNGSIVLYIAYDIVDFNDLNCEALLNCLSDYIYSVCPYEHFEDLSLTELVECAKAFWANGDYSVDRYGNWYDEDFQKI